MLIYQQVIKENIKWKLHFRLYTPENSYTIYDQCYVCQHLTENANQTRM